jgi:hypothetical protein
MAENQFDTINHEHFSYFSFVTIERLAARHALEIIDVERLETHGGSLRVYLAHAGSARRASPAVNELQDYEAANGFLEILPWNLKDEIVQQMRHVRDWGGQFIVPIPEVHVIDPARSAS